MQQMSLRAYKALNETVTGCQTVMRKPTSRKNSRAVIVMKRPAIPDNGVSASQDTVVDCFLPTQMSDSSSPPDLDFDNTTKGVQDSLTNPSEAECFRLFMNEQLVEQETNRYAHQLKESATVPGKLAKQAEITVNEIYTILLAVIVKGLVRKGSLRNYWTTDPVTQTLFFSTLFSLDHFQLLLMALHFPDNATANLRDPLNKIIKLEVFSPL